ncbi:MAG: Asp-tRNA(Asn)/Glu-tRNA(Gln) amidotransferase subunit GatC [Cyclobacteriaceae bacterium]|nr:Asp-tRNA(Asn)/Glu-tRNA(Gln) amidotransferase subunit GatC [Cyclobacteriaceae bacterium SS2]
MKINKEVLQKIAHLARLDLKPEKEESLKQDLEEILDWVEELNEVDTEGIEPLTNMSFEVNTLREDKVGEVLPREKGLKNAPAHDDQYFRVPKVLE